MKTRQSHNCLPTTQVSVNTCIDKLVEIIVKLTGISYHFCMEKVRAEIGRLDPFIESVGTGVLGRVSDALTKNSYKVNGFGIDTNLVVLGGVQKDTVKIAADSVVGFSGAFNPSAKFGDNFLQDEVRNLNKESDVHNNIFSDTVSASMVSLDCTMYPFSNAKMDLSNSYIL
jgi:hypothetical protein